MVMVLSSCNHGAIKAIIRNHHSTHGLYSRSLGQVRFPSILQKGRYNYHCSNSRSISSSFTVDLQKNKLYKQQYKQQQYNQKLATPKPRHYGHKYQIFASTLPGFEQILSHELETKINISKPKQKITNGGITFTISSLTELYNCHLHLGTVSHLLLRVPVVGVRQKDQQHQKEQKQGDVVAAAAFSLKDKYCSNNSGSSSNEMKTTFYAIHPKQLVQKVRQMETSWKELLLLSTPPSQQQNHHHYHHHHYLVPKLDIRATSTKSKLYHTGMIVERVKEGIYQALGLHKNHQQQHEDNQQNSTVRILVRIHRDEVEISIDTSSSPLHKRGYKLSVGKAPLREDIAFAFLYAMGVTALNTSNQCLIDPFCGSGTILIEGASMMLRLPPGRLRSTPCQHTSLYDEKLWKELVERSMKENDENPTNIPLIIGSDRNAGAIQSTMENAKRAGVNKFIQLETCSLKANSFFNTEHDTNISSLESKSKILIATNPPFGLRISPISKKKSKGRNNMHDHPLLPLYQSFGHVIHNLSSAMGIPIDVGILSHDIRLARKSGVPNLKTHFKTRHGGVPVTALGNGDFKA